MGDSNVVPASSALSSTIKAVAKEQSSRVASVILFNMIPTCFYASFDSERINKVKDVDI